MESPHDKRFTLLQATRSLLDPDLRLLQHHSVLWRLDFAFGVAVGNKLFLGFKRAPGILCCAVYRVEGSDLFLLRVENFLALDSMESHVYMGLAPARDSVGVLAALCRSTRTVTPFFGGGGADLKYQRVVLEER